MILCNNSYKCNSKWFNQEWWHNQWVSRWCKLLKWANQWCKLRKWVSLWCKHQYKECQGPNINHRWDLVHNHKWCSHHRNSHNKLQTHTWLNIKINNISKNSEIIKNTILYIAYIQSFLLNRKWFKYQKLMILIR